MTAPLVVMGLDISRYRSGWAVGCSAWSAPKWGTHEPTARGEWKKAMGAELSEWRAFLAAKIEAHGIGYLALETLTVPPAEFSYEGHVPMAQMHGVAAELASDLKIRCGEVAISTWRKHWLGVGFAPKSVAHDGRTAWLKQAAIKQCLTRDWYVQHHDEAEALGIMDYALTCLDNDYQHRHGPAARRIGLKADQAAFRGETHL